MWWKPAQRARTRSLIADNAITPHRVRQTQAAGLRRSVDGDKGYSGLMTKNPEHIAWNSHWAHLQRAEAPRSRLIPILIKSAYSVLCSSRFAAWTRAGKSGPRDRQHPAEDCLL
ncbi:hypothetical protein GWO54_06250 [Corynebacterium macginleyi]|nr:hypothetical protein [Corynebacterium macginleyi]